MSTAGFYGKLASRGDFVSRGLPQSFIAPWDSWLAAGLLASQASLGSPASTSGSIARSAFMREAADSWRFEP